MDTSLESIKQNELRGDNREYSLLLWTKKIKMIVILMIPEDKE